MVTITEFSEYARLKNENSRDFDIVYDFYSVKEFHSIKVLKHTLCKHIRHSYTMSQNNDLLLETHERLKKQLVSLLDLYNYLIGE